ncbi:MAG: hypothetical protein CMK30_06185 [Porticoccaceae bacterium]|nr:hypothetical protein [Porticoccaceae bacterium]|tara:strand:- start:104 stop:1951 length:1848 start_codon:yes stop_codon:yes gene_type:complete
MSELPTSSLGSEKPAVLDISKVSEVSSKATSDFSNVLHEQMSGEDSAQGGNALPKRGEVVLQNRQLQSGMRIKVSEVEPSEEGIAEFALSQGIDPRALMMLQSASPTLSANNNDSLGDGTGLLESREVLLSTKTFESSRAASIASAVSRSKSSSDVLEAAIEIHTLLKNMREVGHDDVSEIGPSLQLNSFKAGGEHVSAGDFEDELSAEGAISVFHQSASINDFTMKSKRFNQRASDQNLTFYIDQENEIGLQNDSLKGLEKLVTTNDGIVKLKNLDPVKINDEELRLTREESISSRLIASLLNKDQRTDGQIKPGVPPLFGGNQARHTTSQSALGEKISNVTSELTGKYIDLGLKEDQLVTKSTIAAAESLKLGDLMGKIAIRVGNRDLAERLNYSKRLGTTEKMPPITLVSSSLEQAPGAPSSGNNNPVASQHTSILAPVINLTSEPSPSLTQPNLADSLETSQDDLTGDIIRRKELQSQLSQRLTQALAQRLSAQIERGSWRVEMDLHPSSLGRVEVQIEMRNGELEASFLSSNPTTRDLLQESLPRLREMLDQFGTNTAYQGLGSGYKGQSDGNPASDGNESQRSSDEEGKLASSDMARKPVSDDGLDVLV